MGTMVSQEKGPSQSMAVVAGRVGEQIRLEKIVKMEQKKADKETLKRTHPCSKADCNTATRNLNWLFYEVNWQVVSRF